MLKKGIQLFAITLLIASCTEKYENSNKVSFYGTFEGQTKSTSFITAGTKSSMYCTALGDLPVLLTASENGVLNPSLPVNLPKGTYDFYSVSTNTATDPGLTFVDGKSQQLTNGVDYLWACVKNKEISGAANVTFTYKHVASKVNLIIKTTAEITDVDIQQVRYTYPNPVGTSLNLQNGEIQKATSKGTMTLVSGIANTRTMICLPTTVPTEFEVIVNCKIDNILTTNKKFTATLNTALESGYEYNVSLTLSSNEASETSITSNIWTEQSKVVTQQ